MRVKADTHPTPSVKLTTRVVFLRGIFARHDFLLDGELDAAVHTSKAGVALALVGQTLPLAIAVVAVVGAQKSLADLPSIPRQAGAGALVAHTVVGAFKMGLWVEWARFLVTGRASPALLVR